MGMILFSLMTTTCTPPTIKFLVGQCHLLYLLSNVRYSINHLFQKWWVKLWHSCHHWRRDPVRYESVESGPESPGLAYQEMSRRESFNAVIITSIHGYQGRLIKHASTYVRSVVISSKVSLISPMTRLKWVLAPLTAASHRLPKCGSRSGMKCHSMFKLEQNGPVARNVKYFNDMQIEHDVKSGSLTNVWRPLEKALIIWFTEPFIPFVRIQWKTRTCCTCFSKESRLLTACRMENDRLSGLSSLLLGNRMERECICLRGIQLELLEACS